MKALLITAAFLFTSLTTTLPGQNLDANYYRQKAAECRAKAAEYNRMADSMRSSGPNINLGGGGGGGPTMSGQYRQAAQALLNAAAQYDAKAQQSGTSSTGGGLGTGPSSGGGNAKAQQLQQLQNSLVGLANAFQAYEARKAEREAARREGEREQAETDRLRMEDSRRQAQLDQLERLLQEQEDRLQRQRQESAQLEDFRTRFGSLSGLQDGTEAPLGTDSGGLAALMMDSAHKPIIRFGKEHVNDPPVYSQRPVIRFGKKPDEASEPLANPAPPVIDREPSTPPPTQTELPSLEDLRKLQVNPYEYAAQRGLAIPRGSDPVVTQQERAEVSGKLAQWGGNAGEVWDDFASRFKGKEAKYEQQFSRDFLAETEKSLLAGRGPNPEGAIAAGWQKLKTTMTVDFAAISQSYAIDKLPEEVAKEIRLKRAAISRFIPSFSYQWEANKDLLEKDVFKPIKSILGQSNE